MNDIGGSGDDITGRFSFRRLSRAERSVDDPIREMEGMLVDEYGRCDYCGHQFFKNLSECACFHFYSSFPLISHLSFLYHTAHL